MVLSLVQLLFLLLGTFQALPSEIEQCYVPNPSHPCSPETIGTDCINQGGETNCLFQGTCLVEDHQVFITIDNEEVLSYENGTQLYVDFSLGAISVKVSNPLGFSAFFLIADGATVMSNTHEDIASCDETKIYNNVNDGVEHIKLAFVGYGENDEMYGILIDLYSETGCASENYCLQCKCAGANIQNSLEGVYASHEECGKAAHALHYDTYSYKNNGLCFPLMFDDCVISYGFSHWNTYTCSSTPSETTTAEPTACIGGSTYSSTGNAPCNACATCTTDEVEIAPCTVTTDTMCAVVCPAEGPTIPEYGYLDECTEFFHEDLCIARCSQGYHGGSRCYKCNEDGEWETCVGTEGLECIPVDCGTLIIDSIAIDCPSTTYEGGDCDVQLPYENETQLVSYNCDWDGVWKQKSPTISPTIAPTHAPSTGSPTSIGYPTYTPTKHPHSSAPTLTPTAVCPAEGPQIPKYGYHDECTDFFFGDLCMTRCSQGYHGGSRCFKCNEDGEWEPCIGTKGLECIPVDCGKLFINFIAMDCPSTTYEGDDCDVQLSCDSETQLVSYKCDWDGVWKQTTNASNCFHPSVSTSQAPTITPTNTPTHSPSTASPTHTSSTASPTSTSSTGYPTHSQHSIPTEYPDSSAPIQSPCILFFIVYLSLTLV